jgi:hypothetical protein
VFFRVLEKWKRGMQTRISRPGARRMRRGCRLAVVCVADESSLLRPHLRRLLQKSAAGMERDDTRCRRRH